ncbi:MAG: hypothetical protein WB729_23890 [Candidatus Sulfotelmatobacter sp.]
MSRMIDQIRASKLPSNMMQFAARGALSVPPEENIEILVYLARNNKIFGDLARMTLAGWDEKASVAAASNPETPREVLDYFLSPDNLRPKLLPALLENPSVPESEMAKFAISASRESIEAMLRSARIRSATSVLTALRSNPYLTKEKSEEVEKLLGGDRTQPVLADPVAEQAQPAAASEVEVEHSPVDVAHDGASGTDEEHVSAYLAEHAAEITAEDGKPFQPVGGIVDLLGADYFPVSQVLDVSEPVAASAPASGNTPAVSVAVAKKAAAPAVPAKRENTMQKINGLDVKGRIQLALKGNKEERSILIRDGTKVVALSVLEAPKLSDGEVEKFALQKNVLEAVLRQIPLKRRFMKNYIVVRNLVSNPRTPLDLGLGLMKHLLPQDLKNISANKEVSETVRKLALKMYKQKLEAANKK